MLRRQKDGSRIPLPCPQSIISYNEKMGGVDRGDQLRGYYCCHTKSRKFYKYIFYFLLDVVITNSFILYKEYAADPVHKTVKEFRLQLARELIGEYCSRRRAGRRGSAIVPLPLRHFPITLTPESPSKRKHVRGRCARCFKSHQRSDTIWFCRECGVWLCHTGDPPSDCFLAWHKNLSTE